MLKSFWSELELLELILIMDLLLVQSKRLLLLTILELISKYSCARILNSLVSLVWPGLEHFVRLQCLATMLESTKNDKIFWQLLRLLLTRWDTTWECFMILITNMVVEEDHVMVRAS